jgi:acyl-CoA synthetase (NDP forming)
MEMAEACLALSYLPARPVRGVSVVGGGGALGVSAADAAEAAGLAMPPLGEDLRQQIETMLPKPGSYAVNPVDVANPYVPPDLLGEVLRMTATDDRIDLQVLAWLPYHYKALAQLTGTSIGDVAPFREIADTAARVATETGIPIVAVMPNQTKGTGDLDVVELIATAREAFLEHRLPVFDDVAAAMRAVGRVTEYYGRPDGI